MRTATVGELALLAGKAYQIHLKIEVQDGDLVYRDWSNYGGINYVDGCVVDYDIDQPVSQATVTLRRDVGHTLSLSPFRTDSTLNRNGAGAFAPAIDIGRRMRVETACTAVGVAPLTSDWKVLHEGTIDTLDFTKNPLSVVARDDGGVLVDATYTAEIPYEYPATSPVAIETLLQTLLTNSPVFPTPTLYVPVSPSYVITSFKTDAESVMDALQRLVQVIGWDLRYKWDAGTSTFRFTLSDPGRTKTTPDAVLNVDQIINISSLKIDRTNIRNSVDVFYGPSTDRKSISVGNVASATRYGQRRIIIQESSDSAIDTLDEAMLEAQNIVADLKDPKSDHQIELFYFWPVELHDLLRSTANNVEYNQDQDYAAVTIRHTITPASARTTIMTRGAPASGYRTWLARAKQGVAPDGADPNSILRVTPSESTDGTTATLALVVGAAVDSVHAYYRTVPRDTDPALAGDFSGNPGTLPVDGTLIQRPVSGALSFTFPQPPRDKRLIARLVPWYLSPGGAYVEGDSVVFPVNPAPPAINAIIHATKTGNLASLSVTLDVGASDVPGTLQIIETVLGVDTTLLTLAVTGALTIDSVGYPVLANRPIPAGAESVSWRALVTDVSGTAWTFGPVSALPALVNGSVTVTENAVARTATITAALTDAGGYLKPTAQDALNPAIVGAVTAHTTLRGVTQAVACTSIPVSGTSGNYVFTINLDPTRAIAVTIYRHYVDGSTDVLWDNALDSNKISDVLNVVPTNNGTTANVFAQFDNDTATGASCAQYSLNGGSTWTPVTVAGDFTATITGIARTTSVQSMIIQGKNAIDGLWGNSTTIPIDPYTADVPSLTAQYKPLTATTGQIIWTCTLGVVTLSIDGGTPSTPAASPIPITLDGSTHDYAFVATLGSQTMSRGVSVPALPPSALPNVYLWNSAQSTTADTITISWTVTNTPASPTYDLLWSNDRGATITTIAGVSSPYVHTKLGTGGHGYDIVAGGTITTLQYAIVVKDSGVKVAQSAWRDVDVDHA